MRTLLEEFGELLIFIIVALGIAGNYYELNYGLTY